MEKREAKVTTDAYKCKFCDFMLIKRNGDWIVGNPAKHLFEKHKDKLAKGVQQPIQAFTKIK